MDRLGRMARWAQGYEPVMVSARRGKTSAPGLGAWCIEIDAQTAGATKPITWGWVAARMNYQEHD
jgi:hypothetical protein